MTMTSDFDRAFEARLRAALDAQAGPDPVWAGSPAARRIADGRRSRRGTLRLLAVAAVLLIGGALVGGLLLGRVPQRTGPAENGWIAFADGELHLVREGERPRRIVGTAEDIFLDECPAFSPDGTRLAYTEYDLRFFEPTEAPHASIPDGEPTPEPTPVPTPRITPEPGAQMRKLMVVGVDTAGQPTSVEVQQPAPEDLRGCPEWSTDGKLLAYVTGVNGSSSQLVVTDLAGRTTDLGPRTSRSDFDFSPDGATIAAVDEDTLWLIPTNGDAARSVSAPGIWWVDWAPDGRHLALVIGPDISVITTDGKVVAKVLDGDGEVVAAAPAWSPDGRWLAFVDGGDLVRVASDGSSPERRSLGDLIGEGQSASVTGWAPAGDRLLVSAGGGFREPISLISVPVDPQAAAVDLLGPDDRYFGGGVSWQARFD